ncbi:hypothetical protein [Sphingomonas glacialis]|uniref:hypothetical protein n=1 Tax=Sphingomonas glacialis TaxID=658225 RepID=UPI00138694A4|nr:hypothetical protein [Sphingomonas glacialis]
MPHPICHDAAPDESRNCPAAPNAGAIDLADAVAIGQADRLSDKAGQPIAVR